jgi:hypothetical protein
LLEGIELADDIFDRAFKKIGMHGRQYSFFEFEPKSLRFSDSTSG